MNRFIDLAAFFRQHLYVIFKKIVDEVNFLIKSFQINVIEATGNKNSQIIFVTSTAKLGNILHPLYFLLILAYEYTRKF